MARLPELADLPFLPLLHGPTPVDEAKSLFSWLGRDRVWVKRDDLASPIYGGNKVRKYEYLLADARARGARSLVTIGGLASTQVTATARFGAALGLPVRAVLFDQPMTEFGRRALLADVTAGAELTHGGSIPTTLWRARRVLREAREHQPYFVLPGASTPLPNVGFVDAALELAAQAAAGEMPHPEVVLVPAGSCGTVVGLALGFRLLGLTTEVIGVRITTALTCNGAYVRLVAWATDRFLRKGSPTYARLARGPLRASIFHGACGPGYGEPTADAWAGADALAAVTGHPGEITYTGKLLAAARAIGKMPRFAQKNLVIWNTLTREPPPVEVDETALAAPLRAIFSGPIVKPAAIART